MKTSTAMNTLPGEIATIDTEQNISLVKVKAAGHLFHSLMLDTPQWLKPAAKVNVLFKETEVMIALPPVNISVRNQVPCEIAAIKTGSIICELTLIIENHLIRSIITRTACDALDLKEKMQVLALIKTNEVSLTND